MLAGGRRLLVALAMVGVSFAAARAVPPEPRIALPSTVAPEGAENIRLKDPRHPDRGVTVYRPERLRGLYQDMIGREVVLSAVYSLAQCITAKYGIDANAPMRAWCRPAISAAAPMAQSCSTAALTFSAGASAGGCVRLGGLSDINAELTVAGAIDGPRDDTLFFFFAVTGRY